MKTRLLTGCAFALGSLIVGCSAYPAGGTEGDVGESSQTLWLGAGARLWPGGVVPVCFLPGLSPEKRTLIKTVLEDEWERAANIDFNGWGTCPTLTASTSNLVATGVGPVPTGYSGQSKQCADGSQSSMTDCTLGTMGPAKAGDFNRVNFLNEAAIDRYIIMHEFGHALGFEHETIGVNPDGTCAQTTTASAPGATSLENEGDRAFSVMDQFMGGAGNGCALNPQTLSNWDVLGARRAYGRKPPGSIVGLGGLCLDIAGASTALGAPVIGYACKGAPNDRFYISEAPPTLRSRMDTPRCLNVNGGVTSPTSATPLTSWSCDATLANEQFSFTGSEWRAMGKMCVAAGSTSTGAELTLQICNGSALQKWDFFGVIGNTYRRIRLNGTNRCVEVPSGAGMGTHLVMGICSSPSQSNERYLFESGGTIVPDTASGLCMNVLGGTTTPGNFIGLWDQCFSNVPHGSQFTVQGTIQSLGQCVDMLGGVPFDGVGIGVFPCTAGAPNEQWEAVW